MVAVRPMYRQRRWTRTKTERCGSQNLHDSGREPFFARQDGAQAGIFTDPASLGKAGCRMKCVDVRQREPAELCQGRRSQPDPFADFRLRPGFTFVASCSLSVAANPGL